jgi:hypothetical protein
MEGSLIITEVKTKMYTRLIEIMRMEYTIGNLRVLILEMLLISQKEKEVELHKKQETMVLVKDTLKNTTSQCMNLEIIDLEIRVKNL